MNSSLTFFSSVHCCVKCSVNWIFSSPQADDKNRLKVFLEHNPSQNIPLRFIQHLKFFRVSPSQKMEDKDKKIN